MVRVEILLRREMFDSNNLIALDRISSAAGFRLRSLHDPVGIVIILFLSRRHRLSNTDSIQKKR